jgi:hypothetical protein
MIYGDEDCLLKDMRFQKKKKKSRTERDCIGCKNSPVYPDYAGGSAGNGELGSAAVGA